MYMGLIIRNEFGPWLISNFFKDTSKEDHDQDHQGNKKSQLETPESDEWSDVIDIHEFPTNAFGLIDFINEDEGSGRISLI